MSMTKKKKKKGKGATQATDGIFMSINENSDQSLHLKCVLHIN